MQNDEGDSVSSKEKQFVADVESMLQDTAYVESVMRRIASKDRRKQEVLRQARRERSKLCFRLAIFAFFVIAIVVLCVFAIAREQQAEDLAASSISPAPSTPFIWGTQFVVPRSIFGMIIPETPTQMASTVSRLYGQFAKQKPSERVSYTVPRNQLVFVIARTQQGPGAPFRFTSDTGDFTETCVLVKNGTATVIGDDNGRILVTYARPVGPKTAFAKACTGNELFFELTS